MSYGMDREQAEIYAKRYALTWELLKELYGTPNKVTCAVEVLTNISRTARYLLTHGPTIKTADTSYTQGNESQQVAFSSWIKDMRDRTQRIETFLREDPTELTEETLEAITDASFLYADTEQLKFLRRVA